MKTTYRMVMDSRDDFKPKAGNPDLEVIRVEHPYGELAKFFHTLVGHPWRWGGRAGWGQAEWDAHVSEPGYEMLLAMHQGTPVGYSELLDHPSGDVHISTMGLSPAFVGKGLGGPFLTAVVERAWAKTSGCVRLSTCSHDHPIAKANYEARGFRVDEVLEGEDNPPIPSFWDLVAAGDGVGR